VIVRGNSGSGKSALAAAVRAARPRGVAILGHDVLRRQILHEEIYGNVLRRLLDDHLGVSRCFRYDLPFEETLRGNWSWPRTRVSVAELRCLECRPPSVT